jgi:hypothetical protein
LQDSGNYIQFWFAESVGTFGFVIRKPCYDFISRKKTFEVETPRSYTSTFQADITLYTEMSREVENVVPYFIPGDAFNKYCVCENGGGVQM